jgi:hypothetical protein
VAIDPLTKSGNWLNMTNLSNLSDGSNATEVCRMNPIREERTDAGNKNLQSL